MPENRLLPHSLLEMAVSSPEKPLFYDAWAEKWMPTSRQAARDRALILSHHLVAQGLKKGDKVLIILENSANWAISEFAIMMAGGIAVPAYMTLNEEGYRHLLDDSGARMAILSWRVPPAFLEAAGRLFAARPSSSSPSSSRPSTLRHIIATDRQGLHIVEKAFGEKAFGEKAGPDENSDENLRFASLEDIADNPVPEKPPSIFESLTPDDICCLIYTSGTVGQPKGVMLTHRSVGSNVRAAFDIILNEAGLNPESQVFLSILPLSHAYEHMAGLHLPAFMGAEIYYCAHPDFLARDLQRVRPTLMAAVPRLYEVLYAKISKKLVRAGRFRVFLFQKTLEIGFKKIEGRKVNRLIDLLCAFLVRRKIHKNMGGRLSYFISGGAALDPEIGNFFRALGVGILQGYGQTEASPLISVNRPGNIRLETVGTAIKGLSVKIAPDGELLAKGDAVMKGYWQNPKASGEVLKDGWLYTGDLAHIDDEGFIHLTGRKKEIIVTSGGDNIAPGNIETRLTREPEIEQAMVIGDNRPWLSALLVVSEELAGKPEAEQIKAAGKAVEKANMALPAHERIRKFIIAEGAFTVENAMLTPTLKIRRHEIMKKYKDQLAKLYPKKV